MLVPEQPWLSAHLAWAACRTPEDGKNVKTTARTHSRVHSRETHSRSPLPLNWLHCEQKVG